MSTKRIVAAAYLLIATCAFANDSASQWIGVYEPISRACERDVLTVSESAFSWGDCKAVSIHQIVNSEQEFVFEIDPSAKCGWAGSIVELSTSPTEPDVNVNAYRSVSDFKAKKHIAYCAYTKR